MKISDILFTFWLICGVVALVVLLKPKPPCKRCKRLKTISGGSTPKYTCDKDYFYTPPKYCRDFEPRGGD